MACPLKADLAPIQAPAPAPHLHLSPSLAALRPLPWRSARRTVLAAGASTAPLSTNPSAAGAAPSLPVRRAAAAGPAAAALAAAPASRMLAADSHHASSVLPSCWYLADKFILVPPIPAACQAQCCGAKNCVEGTCQCPTECPGERLLAKPHACTCLPGVRAGNNHWYITDSLCLA